MDLKKPFAVLEKHSVCLDAADPMDADGEATDQHNATEYKVDILWLVGRVACLNHSCEDSISIPFYSTLTLKCVLWQVIGVVRKKCLFKNRPRAIISKPETATRKQRGVAT